MALRFKRVVLFLLITVILFFSMTLVSSHVGIRPARVEADFVPGDELYVNYYVDTTPNTKIKVLAEGDFAEYVSFSKDSFVGSSGFIATIKMPDVAKKPGPNNLFIKAKEVAEDAGGFGTAVSVGALIRINVPYPGKYADLTLRLDNVNQGEPLNIQLEVASRGKESINAVATLDIYANEEKVDSFNLGSKILNPTEKHTFVKVIDSSLYQPGVYKAVAKIDYGGDSPAIEEKEFRIGHLYVDIVNYTREVKTGKINPFNVYIASEWKNKIEGVYANVSFLDENKKHLASFLTPPVTINGFQTYVLNGFFDATSIKSGKYSANITLYYAGKTTGKIVGVSVKGGISPMLIVILVILVLIILVAAGFFYLIRKKSKK